MQWSPLWIIFKGKIEIAHLLTEQSVHRDDHFKVIGPEEIPILVWGWRKRPQLTLDRPKTYKF